jgi:hypothetical protein
MARAPRRLLTLVALLAAGGAGRGQEPPAPAVVTTLPRPDELPPPPDAGPPGPFVLPPPPPCPDDCPIPALPELRPLAPCGPAPGPTFAVEFGFLAPHVKNALVAPVEVHPGGFVDTVAFPFTAEQDGAFAPKLTMGWRLRDGLGAVLLSYRNVASEGTEVVPGYDILGDGLLRSRLDMNFVDLDYSTRELPLGALWGLRWELGARIATIYFDTQAQGLVLGRRASSFFVGAGPQVALDLTRELPGTGLALFARADGAAHLGRITQRFAESVGDPGAPLLFGGTTRRGSQAVPHLALQAGLSWLSHPDGRYRITVGYQWEQFWAVGTLDESRGDVGLQGLFLRSEFNF